MLESGIPEVNVTTTSVGGTWSNRMQLKEQWNEHESVREHVLWKARQMIVHDRQNDYGPPAESFAKIANLWNAYLGTSLSDYRLSPEDVAMLLALLKFARARANHDHQDSFIDAAGYIALASEMAMIEIEEERRLAEREMGPE